MTSGPASMQTRPSSTHGANPRNGQRHAQYAQEEVEYWWSAFTSRQNRQLIIRSGCNRFHARRSRLPYLGAFEFGHSSDSYEWTAVECWNPVMDHSIDRSALRRLTDRWICLRTHSRSSCCGNICKGRTRKMFRLMPSQSRWFSWKIKAMTCSICTHHFVVLISWTRVADQNRALADDKK